LTLCELTERVTVVALGIFEDGPWIDDEFGILCKARMSGGEGELPLAETANVNGKSNEQLVEDYACWFWNNR
jgi:hypothetical protein